MEATRKGVGYAVKRACMGEGKMLGRAFLAEGQSMPTVMLGRGIMCLGMAGARWVGGSWRRGREAAP